MSLLSTLASHTRRSGARPLRVNLGQFGDDADLRRIAHDIDAVRTRFNDADRPTG